MTNKYENDRNEQCGGKDMRDPYQERRELKDYLQPPAESFAQKEQQRHAAKYDEHGHAINQHAKY